MKIPKYLPAILFAAFVITTSLITAYRSPRGSNDFDTYYKAGKAVIDQAPLYYTGEYHEDKAGIGPFLYPPIAACVLAPFAILPVSAAGVLWNLFNIALAGLCLLWILKFSGENFQAFKKRWIAQTIPVRVISISLAGALVLDNLTMAQINILIFSLALAGLVLWKNGRHFTAGIFIAASILFKLTPLLFLGFFFFRRQWKVLAGVLAGGILLTAVIPTVIFGYETSRIYHRQWLGRTVKPMLVQMVPAWKNQEAHALKKNPEETANIQLANVLTVKNQSLQGTLTRLCLKNRNGYAYSTAFPIYAARKFDKLPVILPLTKSQLSYFIRTVQAGLVFLLFYLTYKTSKNTGRALLAVIALYFLSLPLLSPIARSHQFITWLFALTALFYFSPGRWRAAGWAGCFIYFLQVLPYGKAAGMGAWGNLLLWISFSGILFSSKFLPDENRQSL